MGDYGLRVSKDGKDVLNDDDKDMVFTSKGSIYKVATTGSVNITIHPGDFYASATIAHGLGYVPIAFVVNTTYGTILPTGGQTPYFDYYMNSTNLIIEFVDDSGTLDETDTFKYQILVDKIE